MMDRFPIGSGTMLVAEIMARRADKEKEFLLGRAVMGTKRESNYPAEVATYRELYAQASELYSDILMHGYYIDRR
jgi:hypothetical protein